ncbi:MAG: serine/threonine protein kinase [Scytonema sp. RU_4_4]|nr:serine/threonine protein kinase [Scytonema sp. RU_4_4]NJR75392.1 serine/threonine protein kinase [Scytonema sp. CRU_2_7]
MICCLNPECSDPLNSQETNFCGNCGAELISLLRGRYRIIKPLGGGGFARTYLAEDADKLDEKCAVKQLAPQVQGSWSRQKAIELFHQEAKRLQHLGEHPQIPTLYAYFKEDNYLYLVQQIIEGNDLLQELRQEGVFDEAKIQEFLQDLLPVLVVIHQQQVIHRDIKPENIVRRESDGKFVLLDFGVSKQKTGTVHVKPGTSIGSFGYAPYEQMYSGEAYPASDLYSLGATTFHLLTGVSPWEIWMKQGYSWTSIWREYLTQPISEELGLIIDQLLQENYKLRYQTAEAVLQDLSYEFLPQSTSLHTILSPLQPETLTQQIPQEAPQSPAQYSTEKLLPWAIMAGSGSSFLAIALLSSVGTIWMSSGLWLLIFVGFIFAQPCSIFEKTYLFFVAGITTLFIVLIYRNFYVVNLLKVGIDGFLVLILLVILAALLTFTLLTLSKILNRFISKYF